MSQIPWVIGENVPWSVAWTGEASFRVVDSVDFPGFKEVDQRQQPGEGTPVFSTMHVTRQRRGMFQHLCHVCGEPTPANDRFLFPLESGGMVAMGDGAFRYGGSVPPVHGACGETARARCPHLRGFKGVAVPFPILEGRMIYRTDVVPGLEALARDLPQGEPIILTCYRLHEAEFTDTVLALQTEYGLNRP